MTAKSRPKYTPTQQRIMNLLGDGMRHTRWELMHCLEDSLSDKSVLATHISYMRGYLLSQGLDIVCEHRGNHVAYRLVRLLRRVTAE